MLRPESVDGPYGRAGAPGSSLSLLTRPARPPVPATPLHDGSLHQPGALASLPRLLPPIVHRRVLGPIGQVDRASLRSPLPPRYARLVQTTRPSGLVWRPAGGKRSKARPRKNQARHTAAGKGSLHRTLASSRPPPEPPRQGRRPIPTGRVHLFGAPFPAGLRQASTAAPAWRVLRPLAYSARACGPYGWATDCAHHCSDGLAQRAGTRPPKPCRELSPR